jgi:hypothetical protein
MFLNRCRLLVAMADAFGYGHGFKRGFRDVYAIATSLRKNREDVGSLDSRIDSALLSRDNFGWVAGIMVGMAPLTVLVHQYDDRGVTAGLLTIGVTQAISAGYEAYRLLKPKNTQD